MSGEAPISVTQRKLNFLTQQKRILESKILRSRRLEQIAEQGGIREKVLNDVINKVNRDIKHHGIRCYNVQKFAAVAQEIDDLYLAVGEPTDETVLDAPTDAAENDHDLLHQRVDLTLDKYIAQLPPKWYTSIEEDGASLHQDTYLTSLARIQNLSARRLTLQQRLDTLRTLLSLMEPYRNPKRNVQPNLVTRDGPLSTELQHTRTLAIRVAGRIEEKYGGVQVPATAEDEDEDMEMEMGDMDNGNTKLEKLLSSW